MDIREIKPNELGAVVQRFVDNGVDSMFLTVFKNNHSAQRIYESLGGKKIGDHLAHIGGQETLDHFIWLVVFSEMAMNGKID